MAKRNVILTRTADIQFVGVLEYGVIITAFWDNGQDPQQLLKILENKK